MSKRVRKLFRFFKSSQKGAIQLPIIIGLLVVGIALPAAVTLVQRSQETRGGAAGNETCSVVNNGMTFTGGCKDNCARTGVEIRFGDFDTLCSGAYCCISCVADGQISPQIDFCCSGTVSDYDSEIGNYVCGDGEGGDLAAGPPLTTCCTDAEFKEMLSPVSGSSFETGETITFSGKVKPNVYCAGAWSQQQDALKLYIGDQVVNVPIKDEDQNSWEKFEVGYWSYDWQPQQAGDYDVYFKFYDGTVDGGYDCPSNTIAISVTGPEPTREPAEIVVSCNNPQVEPASVSDGETVTFTSNDYTSGWTSNPRRYYGEEMIQSEMTGNPKNLRCNDANSNCRVENDKCICEVDWNEGNTLWFFNNLSETIDGFDYICTWDNKWSKRVPGTGWIYGAEASPGDNYVCDNNCDVSVEVRRLLPSFTPVPEDDCPKGNQGDLDCDGSINSDDLTVMLQAMFKAPYTPQDGYSTDLTGEGNVNERDLTRLFFYWTE